VLSLHVPTQSNLSLDQRLEDSRPRTESIAECSKTLCASAAASNSNIRSIETSGRSVSSSVRMPFRHASGGADGINLSDSGKPDISETRLILGSYSMHSAGRPSFNARIWA